MPTATLSHAPALKIGDLEVASPVVLAPMAGVTNEAFRRLCREYGAGLYVTEMVTTRALVERNESTMRLIHHHPSEDIRSIQLYGVDPNTVGDAVGLLVDEDRADHIDLNFGCPVPKVTRRGGGLEVRSLRGDLRHGGATRRRRAPHDQDPQGHQR
jgi:tRNA-dihydrouridine synthase